MPLPGTGAPAFAEESEDAESKVEALERERVGAFCAFIWFANQAISKKP